MNLGIGAVYGDYQYLGGEPTDPSSWRAVTNVQYEKPTRWERFGRGAEDIQQGVKQLFGEADESAARDRDIYERAYEQHYGDDIDWMRGLGQAAQSAPLALIPGGASGLAARTASGMLAGGLGGAAIYADEPGERFTNTLMGTGAGGLFGAASKPVLQAAGGLYSGARNFATRAGQVARGIGNVLDEGGITTRISVELGEAAQRAGVNLDELAPAIRETMEMDARALLDATGDLDADAVVRKALVESFGFVDDAAPLRGQVMQDPVAYTAEKNTARAAVAGSDTSEAAMQIANRRQAQQAAAEDYMQQSVGRFGSETAESVGDTLESAVQRRAADLQEGVGAAYRAVDEVSGGASLPRDSLAGRTQQIVAENRDVIPPAVQARIGELIDPQSNRAFTTDELIELDKLITRQMPPSPLNPRIDRAATDLKQALLGVWDDAAEAVGDAAPMYQQAKAAAANRFEQIGPSNKVTSRLFQGAIEPEQAARKLMTAGSRELSGLWNMLDEPAREQARGYVRNEIRNAAMKSGSFSQAAYNNAVNRIGRTRLETIFGPEQAQEILQFGEASRIMFRDPTGSVVNYSGTAPVLGNMVRQAFRAVADQIPGGRFFAGAMDAPPTVNIERSLLPLPTRTDSLLPNPLAEPSGRAIQAGRGLLLPLISEDDR